MRAILIKSARIRPQSRATRQWPKPAWNNCCAAPAIRSSCCELTDRRLRVSGSTKRIQQLAGRAARLARIGGPVRSVAPYGRDNRQRTRRPEDAQLSDHQQLRRISRPTRPSSLCPAAMMATSSVTAFFSIWTANELLFVGRAPTVNWIEFHGQTGGFKVDLIRDDRSPSHPRGNAVSAAPLPLPDPGPECGEST